MDAIKKALQNLNPLEKSWTDEIFKKLHSGDTKGMNIKKLRDMTDVFRVRKGRVRVIYRKDKDGEIIIVAVSKRSETTYGR